MTDKIKHTLGIMVVLYQWEDYGIRVPGSCVESFQQELEEAEFASNMIHMRYHRDTWSYYHWLGLRVYNDASR